MYSQNNRREAKLHGRRVDRDLLPILTWYNLLRALERTKMQFAEQFLACGYVVVPVDHPEPLQHLRSEIFDRAKAIFGHTGNDPERFFNEFHAMQITGARLNELRVKLIAECTQQVDSGRLIFEACAESSCAAGPRSVGPEKHESGHSAAWRSESIRGASRCAGKLRIRDRCLAAPGGLLCLKVDVHLRS